MSAKILLIEPDRKLGQIYRQALKKSGFRTKVISTADNALKVLDQKPLPDLIILEPQLANHGGVEFLYELRSYNDWRTIPVIVNSLIPVGVLSRMQTSLDQLGVVERFYKPQTSLDQLITACRRALSLTPAGS